MDTVAQFYPYRCAVARQLHAGHLPLWTSSVYAGMPLLANPQVGALYPGNWLFFLLPRAGIFTLLFALHIFLGGLGVYLWLRTRHAQYASALAAALLIEVSGTTWAHLAFGSYLYTMAFFPWFLFFFEKFRQGRKERYFIGMTICGALQLLSGAPQIAYYAFIVYLGWELLKLIEGRFSRREIWSFLFLIASFALAAGVAAVQLLPTLELVKNTGRTGKLPLGIIKMGSLSLSGLLRSFLGTSEFPQDAENAAYLGAAGIFFILWGIIASGRKRRISDVILFLGYLSLGVWPLSALYARLLPRYGGFHDPRRILAIAPFVSAPLLERGIAAIRIKGKIPNPARLLFIFLAALAAFFLWRGGQGSLQLWNALGWIPTLTLCTSIILSGILFLCILLADFFLHQRRRIWWNLLIIFSTIEILNYGLCRIDTKTIPESKIRPRFISLLQSSPEDNYAPRIFAYDPSGHYSYYYTRAGFADTYLPNLAAVQGVSDFQGYEPLKPKRYALFLSILNEPHKPLYPAHFGIVRNLDSPLLERAGVTYAIGLPKNIRTKKWKHVTVPTAPKLKLYKHIPSPRRFAFEQNPAIVHTLGDAARELRWQALAGKITGVIECAQKFPSQKTRRNLTPKITIKELRDGFASVEIDAPIAGYLFYREGWFPGWGVYVDGKRGQNLNADVAFPAVHITEGRHLVTWRYRPASFLLGAIISGFSLILLFILASFLLKNRKNAKGSFMTKKHIE